MPAPPAARILIVDDEPAMMKSLRDTLRAHGYETVGCHSGATKSALDDTIRALSFYATEGYWTANATSLRRYTLRLDGFVSAHSPMSGGAVITKPLIFQGKSLSLNFATSAAGTLRVALHSATGEPLVRTELCDEAIRLARVLLRQLPDEAEARGLLSLMLLQHSRRDARISEQAELVLLEEQDRSRWDQDMIDEGLAVLEGAMALRPRSSASVQWTSGRSALPARPASSDGRDGMVASASSAEALVGGGSTGGSSSRVVLGIFRSSIEERPSAHRAVADGRSREGGTGRSDAS